MLLDGIYSFLKIIGEGFSLFCRLCPFNFIGSLLDLASLNRI